MLCFCYYKPLLVPLTCYKVLEREDVANRFLIVTADLNDALNDVPLVSLDISDEVREQASSV